MKLTAYENATADRTPANCPFCGYDGSFDGRGCHYERAEFHRPDSGTERYETRWSQLRCSECNGQFRMLDSAEELESVEMREETVEISPSSLEVLMNNALIDIGNNAFDGENAYDEAVNEAIDDAMDALKNDDDE